jgi:WD40 repeat protein/DNA-directed RNA polymerase specialized sigma24 family protein
VYPYRHNRILFYCLLVPLPDCQIIPLTKKILDRSIHHKVIPEQQPNPERDVAFYLENAQPNDLRVLKLLLDLFAVDVYRLSQAILDEDWRSPPEVDEILSCVDQVFLTAFTNKDEFVGKESLKNWIFTITIKIARRRQQNYKWLGFLGFKSRSPGLSLSERGRSSEDDLGAKRNWKILGNLNTSTRIAVILHFLFDLPHEDISTILGINVKQVIKLYSHAGIDNLQKPDDTPGEFRSKITAALETRWPRPEIDLAKRYHRIVDHLSNRSIAQNHKNIKRRLAEAAILVFVTMTILMAITTISSRDKNISRPLYPPTPRPLPEPVTAMSSKVIDIGASTELSDVNQGLVLFSTEPNLSKDGSHMAFTSSISTFVQGDDNNTTDIFTLNLLTNEIQQVSVSSSGRAGNHASYSASTSANGRYVVFSSVSSNLVSGDFNTCYWYGSKISCMDVFIHDTEKGSTKRISTADDGTEADNNSYYPVISADGHWVVYWSEASNLAEGNQTNCGEGYFNQKCMNLYIYDRVSETTRLIPIGRQSNLSNIGPVSISGDGRYLALTIQANDRIAEHINLANPSEAFIYEPWSDTFTPVNIDSRGNAGNGDSYSPRISTDGRFVVFISMADNLIPVDNNGSMDVFLYDRIDKTTELISFSKDGSTGNAQSGTSTIPGISGWGEQISISDNGRFIAFTSHADNLGSDQFSSCGHPGKSVCVNVYLHDRGTGQTKLVMPGRGLDSFYVNIEISGDGRWIAIVEQFIRCSDKDICSQLWLYDRENETIDFPLRDLNQFPGERSNWPYLSFGQGSKVNAIAFSPDGSTIATAANDSTLKFWYSNGLPLNVIFGHKLPVSDVVFTQDGHYIISSSHDGTVKMWDGFDGPLTDELLRHNSAILGLAISADGNKLAAGGVGGTWLWNKDGEHFNLTGSFHHPGSYVSELAFSPDGAYLALAMSDGTVWIKNTTDYETIMRLGGHSKRVLAVQFSPNGQILASGSEDNTLNLWHITSSNDKSLNAQHIAKVIHPNWVRSVSFSKDGTLLASVALSDKVYLWDLTQNQPLKLLLRISHGEVMSLSFSADDQTLAAGTIGGNIHLWHLSDLEMEP